MTFGFEADATYLVSQLNEEVRDVLGEVFPGLWVRGELHRPRTSQRGHLYFELVEKGHGDRIVGKLDAVIWRTDHQRIRRQLARSDQQLAEGQELRCFGQLDVYPPTGRLQLVVRQVDPLFSLGELERRRRETLRALERAGLLEANQVLDFSELPLRVGLVTSKESAAYHDFLTGLRSARGNGPYPFEVVFAHAATQGRQAEAQVASALKMLGRLARPLDAIVLVRGGGSRSDLAVFDSRRIAEAVAQCPRPVVCGLGHEIDRAIADLVCHTSVKTPSEAATLLVDRVRAAEARLQDAERELVLAARQVLADAERRLQRMDRIAQHGRHALEASHLQVASAARSLSLLAKTRLRRANDKLGRLAEQLAPLACRNLEAAANTRLALGQRLARTARSQLRRHDSLLDGMDRLLHGLSPDRLLERGFSITRLLSEAGPGDLVTRPDQVRSGDQLETRVAGGTVVSTVPGSEDPTESPS